jgi:hypothetical protein
VSPLPLLGSLFQRAYVTTDLDRAVRVFSERYGVSEFVPFPNIHSHHTDGMESELNVALSYAGDTMIELIEPAGGDDRLWRDHLSSNGFQIRFHHNGFLVDSEAELLALAARSDGPTLRLQGISLGTRFLYLDSVAELGHYLEYVLPTPESRRFMEALRERSR